MSAIGGEMYLRQQIINLQETITTQAQCISDLNIYIKNLEDEIQGLYDDLTKTEKDISNISEILEAINKTYKLELPYRLHKNLRKLNI